MSAKAIVACILAASHIYAVPPKVIAGVSKVEGGRAGTVSHNKNGSRDLGPMQINSLWIPVLANAWNVPNDVAEGLIRDDACLNVHVGTWLLSTSIRRAGGDVHRGIGLYHSGTPDKAAIYRAKVIAAIREVDRH